MSVKLDLYRAIKAHLTSLKIDDLAIFKQSEYPSFAIFKESENNLFTILKESETAPYLIATFGHWNSQFSEIENEIQFRFPAVFVEFSSLNWKTEVQTSNSRQSQQQNAECEITLHIGIKNLSKEDVAFEQDIAIIDEIVMRLNTLQGENFTPLVRVSERDDTLKGNIRAWSVTFKTNIKESGIYSGNVGQTVTLKLINNIS